MIAVDTNILVRYFAGDGGDQARLAGAVIDGATAAVPIFVAVPVLVETAWVMARTYGASPGQVALAIKALLDAENIVVEQDSVVRAALRSPHVEFPDCLIHQIGIAAKCSKTLTFDKKFARLQGVELLT